MARTLPPDQKRIGEEAVRRGLVAAVVMEAAAREWAAQDGDESLAGYLIRREVLRREQVDELAAAIAAEGPENAPVVEPAAEGARAPHPSEVIQGYRILERLGRGGMGSVYRAEQTGMNRIVALKILRRPFGKEEEHVERLRREARLVGSLDHPNIVRGLDVGQHGPYHYFAMEFVEGETLRDALKRRGILPEAEALRVVEEVCHALDHAHSRGVIHRDVKPGNIILTPDGTPKLTDYGLAKGPADFTLTQSGVTIGTPQFISPEQARDPAGADIQTDLYSLGATAYNMLTGIPPHTSDTLAGLLTKVLYEKPRTARQVNPRVTPGASFLVEKMMAKDKRYRYRTPRELLRDLRALAAGRSIVPSGWEGDFEVHAARRKLRWVAAIAIATALLAAGAIAWLQHRSALQEREARENRALTALTALLGETNPDTQAGWEVRRDALETFLRSDAHRDTIAYGVAAREQETANRHLGRWGEASAALLSAQTEKQAGRFNGALRLLDDTIATLQQRGSEARDPAKWLRGRRDETAADGLTAAEKAAQKAFGDAERVSAKEGGAVAAVVAVLEAARKRILEDMVEREDQRPAEALQEMLDLVHEARGAVEEAHLNRAWAESRDRLLDEWRFRAAAEMLATRRTALEKDAELQGALASIPPPAAEELRGRVDREARAIRSRNEEALKSLEAKAAEMEKRGQAEAALAELERLESNSLDEVQPQARRLREDLARRRDEAARTAEAEEREFLDRILGLLEQRATQAALRETANEEARLGQRTGRHDGLAAALIAARFLLDGLKREVLAKVQARIEGGGDLPLGLRFEDGLRHTYLKFSNARIRETDEGPWIVFDAPNQPGLEGRLDTLSLEMLLSYSGLASSPADDASHAAMLVKAALLILERGDPQPRHRVEDARMRLVLLQDRLQIARPVVQALLRRADAAVEAMNQRDTDLERTAGEYFTAVLEKLDPQSASFDPLEASRILDSLLRSPFAQTRFVKDRKGHLDDLRLQAQVKIQENKLFSLFPAAKIEKASVQAGDAVTRVTWDFDRPDPLRGLLPPEGGKSRLAVVEPVEGNGGGGWLRIIEGGPGNLLRDAAIAAESPFTSSRYMAISLKYRSEAPLYFQASLAGCHVGVLTDNGRRVDGRGIFAWVRQDWRNPDQAFPDEYRHDWIERNVKGDPLKYRGAREGIRYFQFEPATTYQLRIEWNRGRVTVRVDDREIWKADLGEIRESPPRLRIVTYTPCWIDNLSFEGVVDPVALNRLLKSPR